MFSCMMNNDQKNVLEDDGDDDGDDGGDDDGDDEDDDDEQDEEGESPQGRKAQQQEQKPQEGD